ncbi:helix-turn-helix transcriptional regulator [Alkalilacustris brevis]|uniref:helix-turn-helix transcriptional regulator n=1 Tax=Alkalilacustris brevis TaxID=2026338 RepID=UPI000E0DB629|nr:helix-turn-helix transcriptional regulator [Alkalilacustris brevis]
MLREILSAMAEPMRLAATRLLWDGGAHCLCELMVRLEALQCQRSRHMQARKAAGFVNDRRDARRLRYRLDPALSPQRRAMPDAVMPAHVAKEGLAG